MNYEKKFTYKKIKDQTAGFLKEEEAEILRKGGFSEELIYSLSMQETNSEYIKDLIKQAELAIKSGILVQPYGLDDYERKEYKRMLEEQEYNQKKIEDNKPENIRARIQKELNIEKINIIHEKTNFLNYSDYLKLYESFNDEEKKNIIKYYNYLINANINRMSYNGKIQTITFRFWKDFFYLFYLALNIIKDYKSNSIIFSLGESPAKLIFTQSLFYNDNIYNKLKYKNYPINLNFKYLPLSKLSTLLFIDKGGNFIQPFIERKTYRSHITVFYEYNYTNTIKLMNDNYDKTIECNFKNYILKANLDPLDIIKSNKNIIFVDRAEGLSTVAALFFLYTKLNTWTTLSLEQKNIFFCKFSFYGFNYIPDNNLEKINITINNFKSFIKNLFEIDDIVVNKIIKFKIISYNICRRKEIESYMLNKDNYIFSNSTFISNHLIPFNTIANVFSFISMPELVDLDTRCIKSYDLKNDLPDDLLINFKQTDKQSVNCNFFNFIIFLIFMKLKKESNELDKLIDNIDNINDDLFYKDTKTDIPLDEYIESFTNRGKFIEFFLDNPQIISKTIFNDEITFSYEETFNKDTDKFKNKYLKYKNKYLEYKNKYLFTGE
jgi:hypothetical protein